MKKFFTVMGGLTCAHCVIKLLRFIANKKQWCQDGDSRCFRCVVPLLGIPLVLIGMLLHKQFDYCFVPCCSVCYSVIVQSNQYFSMVQITVLARIPL